MQIEQGKDLFNDYQMGDPILDRSPQAIFIGRDHPDFSYGQTGLLLITGDNNKACEYVFIQDDVEDDMSWVLESKKYTVNRKDVRRVEDLHYAYVDYDPEAVSSKC